MYKYTYLLSQSYRNDTAHLAQNYKSNQIHSNYSYKTSIEPSIQHKVISQSVNKYSNYPQTNNSRKDITGIRQQIKRRQQAHLQGRLIKDVRKNQTRNQFDHKVKQIAQKYSHTPSQIKKQYKLQPQSQNSQNKFYQQYKTQKKSNTYLSKYQTATRDDQNILKQKRINSLHEQQNEQHIKLQRQTIKPLPVSEPEQYNVNRTRVKSQISNHIDSKVSRRPNGMQKRYQYHIEKQIPQSIVPDNSKNYQKGETVTKLSSLQQKIKSLIGSHVPH